MSFMHYLYSLALVAGLTACTEDHTPAQDEAKVDEVLIESEDTLLPPESPVPQEEATTHCIDASMLERLGSEGRSSTFVAILKSFGFEPSGKLGTTPPTTLHFHHAVTQKNLTRVLEKLPEGGYTETVRYQCTPDQLACFEASIDRKNYVKVKGIYRSRGTGSYAYRTFQIERSSCEVIYTEHVGKEVGTPQSGPDSLLYMLRPNAP